MTRTTTENKAHTNLPALNAINTTTISLAALLFWVCFTGCFFATAVAKEQEEELIHSLPDQAADLTAGNDMLVGGLVSPLSGQVCMRQTDLIAKGAQDIVLGRTYLAPYVPGAFSSDNKMDSFCLYKHLSKTYRGWIYLTRRIVQDCEHGSGRTLYLCVD